MNTTNQEIKPGDHFVAMWGYDQTQYSIYRAIETKGNLVTVEGTNSWSNFALKDLAPGSIVKIYTHKRWYLLPPEEQAELRSRGFDHTNHDRFARDQAIKEAEAVEIKKVKRIDGQSWTFIWELSNGETITSQDVSSDLLIIEIIRGYKRCRINTRYGTPQIKIDDVITARLDPDFAANQERYIEQNQYTAYNGR